MGGYLGVRVIGILGLLWGLFLGTGALRALVVINLA